jgi:Holliday junction resolvasome RuvABC endonuclease subunit
MNIIAIDQSLSQSGYVIFSDGKYVTSGTIKTKTDKDLFNRIGLIVKEIDKLITEHKIDKMILELPVSRFIKVTRMLTGFWAVLCWNYKSLNIINIHNKAVKKHCTLPGAIIKKKMGKINVMAYCNKRANLKIDNDNISDAFGLYYTWLDENS